MSGYRIFLTNQEARLVREALEAHRQSAAPEDRAPIDGILDEMDHCEASQGNDDGG